jgi:hypothetical protein
MSARRRHSLDKMLSGSQNRLRTEPRFIGLQPLARRCTLFRDAAL